MIYYDTGTCKAINFKLALIFEALEFEAPQMKFEIETSSFG